MLLSADFLPNAKAWHAPPAQATPGGGASASGAEAVDELAKLQAAAERVRDVERALATSLRGGGPSLPLWAVRALHQAAHSATVLSACCAPDRTLTLAVRRQESFEGVADAARGGGPMAGHSHTPARGLTMWSGYARVGVVED
eukprot:2833204-Prymnesium_polylepis.1